MMVGTAGTEQHIVAAEKKPTSVCAGLFPGALLYSTGVAIYYARCVKTATKQLRESTAAILGVESPASPWSTGAGGRERRPRYKRRRCVAVSDERQSTWVRLAPECPAIALESPLCAPETHA